MREGSDTLGLGRDHPAFLSSQVRGGPSLHSCPTWPPALGVWWCQTFPCSDPWAAGISLPAVDLVWEGHRRGRWVPLETAWHPKMGLEDCLQQQTGSPRSAMGEGDTRPGGPGGWRPEYSSTNVQQAFGSHPQHSGKGPALGSPLHVCSRWDPALPQVPVHALKGIQKSTC